MHLVKFGYIEAKVCEKKTGSRQEIMFLDWARTWIRNGDLTAVPLLLNEVGPMLAEEEEVKETSLYIPYYGEIFNSFFDKCSEDADKKHLFVSLVSTCCSISGVNSHLKVRNMRVFCPDITFIY